MNEENNWEKITTEIINDKHQRSVSELIDTLDYLSMRDGLIENKIWSLQKHLDITFDEEGMIKDVKEDIAEEAIQEFLTLNPHLEVANDMMCLLKAEHRELYDILFERVME